MRTAPALVLSLAVLGGGTARAQAQPPVLPGHLTVWKRPSSAQPTGAVSERGQVSLGRFALDEREALDVQYGQVERFRGFPLRALFLASPPPPGTDLALLHFANGMVVPVAPGDAPALKRLDLFVALERWTPAAPGEPAHWSRDFPPVYKPVAPGRDRRPITFAGNKLTTASLGHPVAARSGAVGFSPWLHVDSLTGVEYVEAAAYARQFATREGDDSRGLRVFEQTCQFCHGVAKVGASFGWDFAGPVPLTEYRGRRALALHVQYREGDAPERGLMMPALPELDDAAVGALWDWMDHITREGPKPYTPRR